MFYVRFVILYLIVKLFNGCFESLRETCVSVLFTDTVSASSVAPDSRQIVKKYLMNQ